MSRAARVIFRLLGVVELIADGYDLVRGWFKKPPRTVQDMLDEQDEAIPLRRVKETIHPPPSTQRSRGAPGRGPGS